MQPERSSAISSILLLSSRLSLCLQTVYFLQGFLTKLCVHLSLPCGCIMWSLCHNCLKSWQLLKCKAISVFCLWIYSVFEKYVWYHILFISKVDWMISKCHSVSCFLLYTDFHMWVETCYKEWVSFGSLVCSEEHSTCAFSQFSSPYALTVSTQCNI